MVAGIVLARQRRAVPGGLPRRVQGSMSDWRVRPLYSASLHSFHSAYTWGPGLSMVAEPCSTTCVLLVYLLIGLGRTVSDLGP